MPRCPDGSDEDELAELAERVGADERFAIEPLFHDGGASLALCGEIDTAALPALKTALSLVVKRRPRSVEVDLSGATFVSASAVKSLLEAAEHLRELVFYKSDSTTERLVRLIGAELALGCRQVRFEGRRNGQARKASRYARTADRSSVREAPRRAAGGKLSGRRGAAEVGSPSGAPPGRAQEAKAIAVKLVENS